MRAEEKIAPHMVELARELDKRLESLGGEHMGFMLLVFPLNRAGTCNRIQNVETSSAIQVLSQTLRYLRQDQKPPRAIEVH